MTRWFGLIAALAYQAGGIFHRTFGQVADEGIGAAVRCKEIFGNAKLTVGPQRDARVIRERPAHRSGGARGDYVILRDRVTGCGHFFEPFDDDGRSGLNRFDVGNDIVCRPCRANG